MSVPVGRLLIALLIACGLVVAGVRPGVAQKPGPGEGPILGISFDVAITFRDPGNPNELALRLSGRGNVTGEFEVRVDSGGLGFDVEVVSAGGRIYVRIGNEPWMYLDIAEIMALVDRMGPRGRMQPVDSPECMQALMDFAMRFQQPADLLREVGNFQPARPDAIDGIAVLHYAGTLDLARLAAILAPLLENPACTGDQMMSVSDLLEVLGIEDLPSIRYDVYLGQADGFPYRLRLLLDGGDDGAIELVANARPSRTFFDIRAPQGAIPFPLGPLPAR